MSQTTVERRRLDFHSWAEALADIDHLRAVGYLRAGNWDLSQILDHVGEGLRTAVRGNEHQGPWIIRKIIGPIILKRILKQRRMQAGVKVPKWWLPGPAQDESAAINRFRSDLSTFQATQTPLHPHPFLGKMSKPQWDELALLHAAHHLSFLTPKS